MSRRSAWKQSSYNESVKAHWFIQSYCTIDILFSNQKFKKISNTLKQQIQLLIEW